MATTTNFGWETPDDTDLVKDGAAAIRTALGGVDTSFIDLKGGTTGQILSKASNTDLDYTWVTTDDANAIQNAIVDAKGDLITATAADTPARLAVGATNGMTLQVDSSTATGLKWATASSGGMTLLSTTTLSGALTTVSGIPSTYKSLKIIGYNLTNNTSAGVLRIEVNGQSNSGYVGISGTATVNRINDYIRPDQTWERTDNDNGFTLDIDNYTSSASPFAHPISFRGFYKAAGNVWNAFNLAGAAYCSTAPISSVGFIQTGGTWSAGTILIYGVQ